MTEKEKKYYHRDVETGELNEISKECYEQMQAASWAATRPQTEKKIGKIVVFGTGGEMPQGDLEQLFYNLEL